MQLLAKNISKFEPNVKVEVSTDQLATWVNNEQRIHLIRELRRFVDIGLKDAKEAIFDCFGLQHPEGQRMNATFVREYPKEEQINRIIELFKKHSVEPEPVKKMVEVDKVIEDIDNEMSKNDLERSRVFNEYIKNRNTIQTLKEVIQTIQSMNVAKIATMYKLASKLRKDIAALEEDNRGLNIHMSNLLQRNEGLLMARCVVINISGEKK